ncbi:MAG TPA: FAD-dependent oxidoreductase, partial [Smithellaceae bacterium]|nr:FAD-dependent oxidoreductase [Smithellaceae bacterium]
MPYYIGDVIQEQSRLIARTPEKFRDGGIDVMLSSKVAGIDPAAGTVDLEGGRRLAYDYLMMATGAMAFVPSMPGLDLPGVFSLRNLEDAITIKSWLQDKNAKRVVIIGGGFIGLEMSEALHAAGIAATIIHKDPLPANRWDPELSALMLEELQSHGVEFVANTAAQGIEKGSAAPLRVKTSTGDFEGDLVLLAIGVRPDATLAKTIGLRIGATGAIAVDFSQKTSIENIYAAGDCCESFHKVSRRWVHVPLGDVANKQGRTAGRNIGGRPMLFDGIVGAQSFRLFTLECAATGLSEKEALAAGFSPVSNITWGSAMAPSLGMRKLGLKLTADRSTGRLLGAQAVGIAGAV